MVKRKRPQQERDADMVFLADLGYRRKVLANYYGISDSTVKNILAQRRKEMK